MTLLSGLRCLLLSLLFVLIPLAAAAQPASQAYRGIVLSSHDGAPAKRSQLNCPDTLNGLEGFTFTESIINNDGAIQNFFLNATVTPEMVIDNLGTTAGNWTQQDDQNARLDIALFPGGGTTVDLQVGLFPRVTGEATFEIAFGSNGMTTFTDSCSISINLDGIITLDGDLVIGDGETLTIADGIELHLVADSVQLTLGDGARFDGDGVFVFSNRGNNTLFIGSPSGKNSSGQVQAFMENLRIINGTTVDVKTQSGDVATLIITNRLEVNDGEFNFGDNHVRIASEKDGLLPRFHIGDDSAINGGGTVFLDVQAAVDGGFPNTREGAFVVSGGGNLNMAFVKGTNAGVRLELPQIGADNLSSNLAGALFLTETRTIVGGFRSVGASRTEFDRLQYLTGDLEVLGPGAEVFPRDGVCDSGNESGVYFFSPVIIGGELSLNNTDDPALVCATQGVSFEPSDLTAKAISTVRGKFTAHGPTGIALRADNRGLHSLALEGDLSADGSVTFFLDQPCPVCSDIGNRVLFTGSSNQNLQFPGTLLIACVEITKTATDNIVEIDANSGIFQIDSTLILTRGTFVTNGLLDMNGGTELADGGCVAVNSDDDGRGVMDRGTATDTYHNDLSADYKPRAVKYIGTVNQITGDEIPGPDSGDPDAALHEVKVDLPSGDQVVSLSKPLWIVGTVRLTSGDLNLSGFDLDLGTTGELVESPGSTVRGTLGSVRAERNLVVPIGENVGGTGAIITSQMSLGLTTLVRGHAFQILDGPQGIRRFYDIMPPMNTQLDATFTFSYDESELSGLSETDLQLFRSEDMGLTWTRVGGDVDTTANTVTITGVDSFSRWTLGSGVRVGIDESDPLPSTVRLDQNFPNPFNSYTTIQFALPKAEQVTLIVFNLLGQKVRTLLMQEARPAGVHRLPFDGQNDAGLELTSGIYVYQLKAGDFIHSKKLLLLK